MHFIYFISFQLLLPEGLSVAALSNLVFHHRIILGVRHTTFSLLELPIPSTSITDTYLIPEIRTRQNRATTIN